MKFYDTVTTFNENKKIKKLRQKKMKELKINEGDFIRGAVYKALDIIEK